MIGGKVIETIVLFDRVWVNCRDTHHPNTCAIFVDRTSEARSISEGDQIWWQGPHAFWTPRGRHFSDRKLKRIGCSGVNRPALVLA